MGRKTLVLAAMLLLLLPVAGSGEDAPPAPAEAVYSQAGKYHDSGQLDKAVEAYSKVISLDPSFANAYWNRGNIHYQRQNFQGAEADWRKVIYLAPDHADAHGMLGWLLVEQGRLAEAEPLLLRAIAIDEKTGAAGLTTKLNNLAVLYEKVGRVDEAVKVCRKALAIDEQRLGPNHPDIAFDLNTLAGLLSRMGRLEEAEPLYQRAIGSTEKTLGPEHPNVAGSMANLAVLYERLGRYAEAEALDLKVLAIDEKTLGKDDPRGASSLINLAGLYRKTGRYQDAEPLYKRALAIRERALGPNHPKVASVLQSLAALHLQVGRYTDAETACLHGLEITEKTLGENHPDLAAGYNTLAELYRMTGRYAEAEPLYKRAASILEKRRLTSSDDMAAIIGNMAGLYVMTGRYPEAEDLLKRQLKIRESIFGPAHPALVTSLNNLAEVARKTGRLAEAEEIWARALAILEEAAWTKHPYYITILSNLGFLYVDTKRYERGESLLQQGLAYDERVFGPRHLNTAIDLANIAWLYQESGRLQQADALYRRALPIALDAAAPELLYKIQNGYSTLLMRQGNMEGAIFLGKQAINTIQAMRRDVAAMGKESLRSFTETVEKGYRRLADLLISRGRLAEAQQVLAMLKEEEYFQYIRRNSSAAEKLDTRAGFITPEIPWDTEYRNLLEKSARTGAELLRLREIDRKGMLRPDEKDRLKELEAVSRQQDIAFNDFFTRLLTGLKEDVHKQAKASNGAIFTVNQEVTAALQKALANLGKGTVALQYLITDDAVRIILTTAEKQIERSGKIKAADLNGKLFAFRDMLKDPRKDPRPMGNELYDLLLGPVAEELSRSQAQTLMLSLEGPLRYVPFAALYDGTSYVAERYRTVIYADAARQTVTLPVRQDWTVAALGVSAQVHPDFSPLPSVPEEISGIVRKDGKGAIPGEVHLDREFDERRLQEASRRNPVLHIASHFKFSPGIEKDSFLLLGDGTAYTLDKVRTGSAFSSAELLTLSACETAMGTTGTGREIEGFGALAMNAGTKAVIATLWPIADTSTAQLMQTFYRLREEQKLTKAEALRQAQLALLKPLPASENEDKGTQPKKSRRQRNYATDPDRPFAHPYYWAPFILMGNWK